MSYVISRICNVRVTIYNINVRCLLLPKVNNDKIKLSIYWCVAYLPSEASIIEH
jgi:hypothetical protein